MDKISAQEKIEHLRHSAAHLLAAAVLELYPEAKNTIGPAIENGFYYDFDFKKPITEADLIKIEDKMGELLPKWTKFTHREVSPEEAKKIFTNNPYKLELIEEFAKEGKTLTLYECGGFVDLCRGGHSENPSEELKAFKLLSLAGAYWRGNEKNKMLTRIYGTAFPSQEKLDEYLSQQEEAKKRDHKKLGPQLELFMFHETAPGMPYWLPKGFIIYDQLIRFWRKEHQKRDYQEIMSPILNKKELYEISGHFEHYWQDMFVANMGPGEIYGVKAMSCPNAMLVFGSKTRSYKDLPLRFSDIDPLHRYELSGTLNGLFRVREFHQDDAHIYVTEEQIEDEFKRLFEIIDLFYSIFNLEYSFRLGTRPDKFMGEERVWDKAEKTLEEILKKSDKPYFIAEGEGAFYGPKIDILMKDSLGREWQMGTLQLDFQQPLRFKLKYTDKEGKEQSPIVIHRVIYGSLERFIGILIENFGGAFPLWLSPVQVKVIPISDKNLDYAKQIEIELNKSCIRVELDQRSEKMQAKIRDAQLMKVPYMAIVGGREQENNTVAIRTREGKDLGSIPVKQFLDQLTTEIESKA